jgi:SAM-dependent methyltransferase
MQSIESQSKNMSQVEEFYDGFSSHFVEDIAVRNERIALQLSFAANAIPSSVESILVIGFGSGEGAFFIATKIAPIATVTAFDISAENLKMARALFSHPRIAYRQLDVTAEPIEGQWDVVVLPDVYEHIPKESRVVLHSKIRQGLAPHGRVVITIPSPGKQESLRQSGRGLQIVDETVTLDDLLRLSEDVNGSLTYFNMVSIWETNDYIHAVIERGADFVRPIGKADMVPLKGWPRRSVWWRGFDFAANRFHLRALAESVRRWKIKRRLRRGAGR